MNLQLQDWENILSPHLSIIELLSEIPLDRSVHMQLEQYLAAFVQRHGLTEATHLLRQEYPAVFVTYLAFKAAFNDERGFWDGVARTMGLESQHPLFHPAHHWGQTFLEIIEQHPNLRSFEGVSRLEYITPIRLHGGIPAFSLPDFFQHILLPSIEKAPYDGMDDESALKALLEHYTAQLFVDDVVRHFFRHAGEAARKFFSKCRHMARLAQANQTMPEPAELGLRPYVVQSFANFQYNQTSPSKRRRRPHLYFDPYLPAFRIILPPQPLSLEQAGHRCDARLYAPDSGEVYAQQARLRPRRQGQEWFIEEVDWLLEEPLPTVQAGFFSAGQEAPLYSYPLRLLPPSGYPPLLAFRYEDTRQISLSSTLPARALWLFYPADVELDVDEKARLETLHPFAPPWDGWQSAAWDLSETRLLRLFRDGQDICPPISVFRALEPSLTPSILPLHVLAVDDKPLYNVSPQICLPLRNPEAPQDELKDWLVHLESRYAAAPQGNWQAKASELPCTTENTEAWLSLAPWLGESPAGTYHLTLQHRGRPVSKLPFRVCARLEINGLQPYYLPTPRGAQPVSFQVHLPCGFRMVSENDAEINPSPAKWDVLGVKVPPHTSQADLCLELPAKPEDIRIPLRVSIPRLRWALALEKGKALEWAHQPITRPLAELLQTNLAHYRPRLRVELPVMEGQKPLTALHLTAPGHETSLQISESRLLAGHWLEFDISAFFDTLDAYPDESVFELSLELLDVKRELNLHLPVLRLSRELDIRVCHFESIPQGGWCLHWYEPRPLRHRRLRLWSRWQPWADPLEIHLPDDAPSSDTTPGKGWWMYNIPEEFGLPPSDYRAQFVAVSPYEHNSPPPFPPEHAIEIQMITPQSRLWQIENELTNAAPARAFALHLEKLCIYHTQKHNEAKQQEIQWCLGHWRDGSLIHLEALARWLGKYDYQENQRAFLMQLFREDILKQLEEERHPPEFVQKYLSNIANLHTIKPESAHRVLNLAHDPAVILYALKSLLRSDAEEARHTFWDTLVQGRFSEADAAALLKDNSNFVRHLLKDTPDSPHRSRLLRELSRYLDLPEYLVKVGYYVLCDAGWGRLLEIRNTRVENLFFPAEETPTLVLELLHWPGQKVEIDLDRRQATLIDRKGAYRCACGRFAALGGEQTRSAWQCHQAFCCQTTELPLTESFLFMSHPIYRASAPENPLDTRSGA